MKPNTITLKLYTKSFLDKQNKRVYQITSWVKNKHHHRLKNSATTWTDGYMSWFIDGRIIKKMEPNGQTDTYEWNDTDAR